MIAYLADHLTALAQDHDFNWLAMATDMGALARQLERLLHDEREPERGVPCFECGDPLVRRFGKPTPCRHDTPARRHLDVVRRGAQEARARLDVLATYPELGPPTYADHRAARRTPTGAEQTAARRPCHACTTSRLGQGGIEDPTVGQSWECEGCRKHYDAGEYANAVRRHLLTAGPNGDGWTHIQMAAEAASTQTGMAIPAATVRKWMDREKVSGCCQWQPGVTWGQRLVFWPDVADEAAAAVIRAEATERKRLERDRQIQQLQKAVAAGEDVDAAGRRLGIHPSRVAAIEVEWDAERRRSKESA
ncbi:hypothetical protein NOCARDAX2BIS_590030 [Nocardioides sp. AX2bis]|nr:hypothetical protein NOCARDAX2BIS_590030 [Nocardioides sp. AX2bis]